MKTDIKAAELLSIEQAVMAQKGQYKNERFFRRAEGAYKLEPLYPRLSAHAFKPAPSSLITAWSSFRP